MPLSLDPGGESIEHRIRRANDLAAIRQKFQATSAFDGTLRQLVSQIIAQNDNEALYERWSADVEPKLRELDAELKQRDDTISEQAVEIARLQAMLEHRQPSAVEAITGHLRAVEHESA